MAPSTLPTGQRADVPEGNKLLSLRQIQKTDIVSALLYADRALFQ